jgi:transcriptional regulator with XRE-family HTH domain
MLRKLQNYLRAYRKQYGLSQKEVAFLLGVKASVKVSQYEMFQRVPSLETALALQAIFGVPVAELFAGIYEKVEKEISNRAKILDSKLQNDPAGQTTSRKIELLRAIAITPYINEENP